MKLSYDLSLTKLMILAYCRSGASEASEGTTLYNITIKRFSRIWYVLSEFSRTQFGCDSLSLQILSQKWHLVVKIEF